MSHLDIVVLTNIATLVLSWGGSLLTAGIALGRLRADIAQLKDDVKTIKGMFIMRLRPENRPGRRE